MKLRLFSLLLLSAAGCGREGYDQALPEAVVFGDDSPTSSVVLADASIVLEAEAAGASAELSRKSANDASGGAYMQSAEDADAAGVLRFTFDVTRDASYTLWVRGRGPNGSSDSVYARIDGGSKKTVHVPSKRWVWRSGGERKLSARRHTVELVVRETGVEIDQIVLTTGDDAPSGIVTGEPQTPPDDADDDDDDEPSTPTEPSEPTEPTTPSDASVPADVLNLTNWKVTLPTGSSGKPTEVKQPVLATFSVDPYFRLDAAKEGVVFRAHAGGVTTSGSSYPRSELREMASNGTANAAWSSTSGTHTLTLTEAITHTPVAKPHVVAAQIHDAEDDVVMVRLEGTHLFLEGGGEDLGTLDPGYVLGTRFTVRLTASGGVIRAYYNDLTTPKVTVSRSVSGCYFKAGAYTQSNTSKGDAASAYGEVVIYDLHLTHQ